MLKTDILRLLDAANVLVPIGSTWRHKSGHDYGVLGHDFDTELSSIRVRYVSVNDETGIVYSRPIVMWTPDRFLLVDSGERRAHTPGVTRTEACMI